MCQVFQKTTVVQEQLAAAQARPPPGPTHHRAAAARKYERTPYPLIQPTVSSRISRTVKITVITFFFTVFRQTNNGYNVFFTVFRLSYLCGNLL